MSASGIVAVRDQNAHDHMSPNIRLRSLTTKPSVRRSETQRRRVYLDIDLLSFIEICAGAVVLKKARISLLLSFLTGYRCGCPGES